MKLILSRKGFDSASGGCPSPIFPDGSIWSIPIPDVNSCVKYRDLRHPNFEPSRVVSDLTRGQIKPSIGVHIDPDLERVTLDRLAGWQPLFGQHGSAQGHLRNQEVGPGDLFLFFGLFQDVDQDSKGSWRFVTSSPKRHIIWGWLQVGGAYPITEELLEQCPWAAYHPHFSIDSKINNQMYLGDESLSVNKAYPAAGVFKNLQTATVLSKVSSQTPSTWLLPKWFYPKRGRRPLSYHDRKDRWRLLRNSGCELQAVARGQEFVLHLDDYPEARDWLAFEIFTSQGLAG